MKQAWKEREITVKLLTVQIVNSYNNQIEDRIKITFLLTSSSCNEKVSTWCLEKATLFFSRHSLGLPYIIFSEAV